MYPIIFRIGNFELHTYGLTIALAFALGTYIAIKRGKRYGFTGAQIYDLAMLAMIAGLVGSRFAYVIMHTDEFRGRWWDTVNPFQSTGEIGLSGMILLGGVVFGTLMITIYTILKRLHWGKVADIVTPGVVVGIAMGRVGCFFNGCCFGKPSNLPWAVHFPPGSFAHYVYPDTGIHPTQLYEILCSLLIFIVLIKIEKRKPFQGFSFALFLILYGAFRFLNEFLRYYGGFEAGMNLLRIGGINITFSQITAIFMIFAGIIIILIGKRSIKFEQKA